MSENFLEHLYLPFEQEPVAGGARIGGTGLGMPITKNLVTLLGGTISVNSKLGEGTVFTVELPFRSVKPCGTSKFPSLNALKVLVGDNDRDACLYASLLMHKFGIEARWVLSGQETIEEIRRTHEAGEDYDVCLIDWKMPDMNGIETARQVRSIVGPDTLIIIITAYDYADIEEAAREAGVNRFLTKPFFASSLYNTLMDATGQKMIPDISQVNRQEHRK